jgi:hypothetical protein
MKKDEIPQDLGALGKITKEVCYATDSSGKYTTALSSGWNVKTDALDAAWGDIEKRIIAAKQKVLNNEVSPIFLFMEYSLMNLKILSDYTCFWKWQIKRHLRPEIFNKLAIEKLQKYAEAFNTTIADLKSMTVHEK